jgi:hypothetical protein
MESRIIQSGNGTYIVQNRIPQNNYKLNTRELHDADVTINSETIEQYKILLKQNREESE